MSRFNVLLSRELKGFFYSPIAYVVLCFFLGLMGFNLYVTLLLFDGHTQSFLPLEFFFNSAVFWFSYILVIPLLTMRVYFEEFKLGTIETLMTAPVRDEEVVLAKFAGTFVFYLILWAPTLLYFGLLQLITHQPAAQSVGSLAGSYLLVFVMGLFYLSIGGLASALTQNQIVAAIVSLVAIVVVFFLGIVITVLPNLGQNARDFASYFSSALHMQNFARGLLDTRPLVFYLSFAALLQFVTLQVFQYRKWRF